ncbi:MAG: MoxR-like ATPase, partial [Arenicella sp.]
AAKALAYVEGRDSVLPDDIKLLASYTAAHRLHCNDGSDSTDALNELVAGVEVL